jgi:hypothetical protein
MRFRDWFKLLVRGRFRIHPARLPIALGATVYSLANEALAALDRCAYGRCVAQTPIEHPPVFIIGHWRTGTTFLHELLARDDRFAFPSTYECMAPHHFLLSGGVLSRLLRWFAPAKRPMDDMPLGVDLPQEDDIALLALGAPTPLARLAFANQPPPYEGMLDGDTADPAELARWRTAMLAFVRRLTFAKRKRLLLKSPPHTGKMAQLAAMFPGARFIHLLRSPRDVFASTRRLWQALDWAYSLQAAHHRQLDEQIFNALERMYRAFQRQRGELPVDAICDVAYERLVADPLGETERIYEHLSLGDFAHCRDKLAAYIDGIRDYRPNDHHLDRATLRQIDHRWSAYAKLHDAALGENPSQYRQDSGLLIQPRRRESQPLLTPTA